MGVNCPILNLQGCKEIIYYKKGFKEIIYIYKKGFKEIIYI